MTQQNLTQDEEEELQALDKLIPMLEDEAKNIDDATAEYDAKVNEATNDGDKKLDDLEKELDDTEEQLKMKIQEENGSQSQGSQTPQDTQTPQTPGGTQSTPVE